jgi:photosystem II stability/assembly factor-like uncharacterized protein
MIDSYFLDGGAFVMDPYDTATYWSGGRHYESPSYYKSVSKTTNSGMTWMRYDLTTENGMCEGLAIDPTDSDIVYAAGYPGFHKTTNGGNVWNEVSGGLSGTTYTVVVDSDDPTIVYTGGTNGIFKSTSSGNNWTDMGLSAVNAILIHPQDHDCLYAGTQSGVYISTDAGVSWEAMNEGLDDLHITSLGIFPEYYLFCGADIGGMYRWDISTGTAEYREYPVRVLSAMPNPMRQGTTIFYALSQMSRVELSVFDVQGRYVRTLVSEVQTAGIHTGYWDGRDGMGVPVAAGVYFCRMITSSENHILKVIVTR